MDSKKQSKELEKPFTVATKKLAEYLEQGIEEDEALHAKLVVQTVNAYVKMRAVEAHEAGIKFAVARVVAVSPEELKGLVQKSLPEFIAR